MTTISRHTASLMVDGHRYAPTELELTLDEDGVPFAALQATIGRDNVKDPDVAVNGDFSLGWLDVFANDPGSWWFWPDGIPGPSATVDVDGVAVTTWTDDSVNGYQGAYRFQSVEPRTGYTVTTRVRVSRVVSQMKLTVDLYNGGLWTYEAGQVTVENVPADGEWHELTVVVAAPEKAEYVHATVTSPDQFVDGDVVEMDGFRVLRHDPLPTVDPRKPQRVQVTLRQDFGEGDPVSVLSEEYGPYSIAAMERAANLVPDPTFEDGLAGWRGLDEALGDPFAATTEIVWSDEQARTGTHSMELLPDVAQGGAIMAETFEIQPDVKFTASAWVYGTGIRPTGIFMARIVVYYYDGEDYLGFYDEGVVGEVSGPPGVETTPYGQWHQVVVSNATPPPEATHARVQVDAVASPLQEERMWFDDITFGVARTTLTDLTNEYGRPYNAFGMRPSTRRRANLYLRSRADDHGAGTVAIAAASGEALLADYALADTTPLNGGATVRDCVNTVLLRVLGTAVSTPSTGGEPVEAEAQAWTPGESAWSYLTSITGSAGLRLWCDAVGLWHLEDPETARVPGGLAIGPESATVLEGSLDRDANGWADSAVVEYSWTDGAGDRHTRYDATPPGARTITRKVERPYPGRGFARAIARKAQALGRVVRVGAVADYDIEPLQAAQITIPGTLLQAGNVAAVQWRLPDDEMTVRTRDLMGVDPEDWLFLTPGRTWGDEPVGGSWTSEEVI